MKNVTDTGRGVLRCAIYTRKSNEEGLEQDFNSLHAQREACEAYIKSQVGERWRLIPAPYNDGGFSGGNIDRPGLTRLLQDVEAGKVDIIVVYKVDRLTRSLMDFAKIVEKLDAKSVSFVSVTQAFNTTTSMGRLTLNVLLSFAQFEREVTAERVRDKIAASKAKGMWMGGNVPLGYDLQNRKLIPNSREAEQVRRIFTRYLELRSVPQLVDELEADDVRSKRWTSRRGNTIGGVRLRPGGVCYILQNRLYLGEIVHQGKAFPGNHEAIIDPVTFDAVQQVLTANRRVHHSRPTRAAGSPLTNLVFDALENPMMPTFAYGRGKKVYRYYASNGPGAAPLGADAVTRVSAAKLEQLVLERLTRLSGREEPLDWITVQDSIRNISVMPDGFSLLLNGASQTPRLAGEGLAQFDATTEEDGRLLIHCAHHWRSAPVRCDEGRFVSSSAEHPSGHPLSKLLKSAHARLVDHKLSPMEPDQHAGGSAPTEKRVRRMMALGLLAPDIQDAVLSGTIEMHADRLMASNLPLAWSDQRARFGLAD